PVIIPTPDMNKPAMPGEGPGPVIIPTPDMNKPAMPGEGPGPVIIPTPDMNKPAMPGEGSGPVIIPTPDMNKPAVPGEGPGPVIIPALDVNQPTEQGKGSKPVPMPLPEEHTIGSKSKEHKKEQGKKELERYVENLQETEQELETRYQDEIKVLTRLQNLFNESQDKETLAKRVQSIIEASIQPLAQSELNPYQNRGNSVPRRPVEDEEQQYLNEIENVLKSIQDNMSKPPSQKKTFLKDSIDEKDIEEDKSASYKRDLMRVRDIFTDSAEIEPFEEKDENIDWVRISMAELISMPQFSYEWCTNPFVTYCYHKFGFLILGRDKHIEQYYIGVPDIYDTKRKFILSIDKVESFRGRSNQNLKPGDYGYWIVRV
ncbi:MAG: DUF6128 domain-containing protein, partial [Niameybacter sp.]